MSNVEKSPAEQTVCAGLLTADGATDAPADGAAAEPADGTVDGSATPAARAASTAPDTSAASPADAPSPSPEEDVELLEPREVPLGGPRAMLVRRSLPNRDRRMIGAWCFADAYGPAGIAGQPGMQVPPHPHTGLQTVSWLLEGEIRHQDSLGSAQLVRPGELNLMTAGHGIAHAETSPPDHSPALHGVQLWIALPAEHRDGPADFEHHAGLPVLSDGGGTVTVIAGELAGTRSPARFHSPLVGAEAALAEQGRLRLPLTPGFEHGVLTLSDAPVTVDGVRVNNGSMRYLGPGRHEVLLEAGAPARALLIGGEPFEEELVMWWNYVARSHEEIVQAREDWVAGRRFGEVRGYDGDPLPAPALPNVPLKPRGRMR